MQPVVPAHSSLLAFFRDEFLPRARDTLAAGAMPDGDAWYRQQIRAYTTLDLTPREIHGIGLDEVARIQAEMDAIIAKVGFKGSFAEFLTFLRTDPRFYAKTPEELLRRAAWIATRGAGALGKVNGTLPRGRFPLRPVPPELAPYWPAGRGGADQAGGNTRTPPSRP